MQKLTLEEAKAIYGYTQETHPDIFKNMYDKAWISTFTSEEAIGKKVAIKKPAKGNPIAVFIGGQIGAGKSNLILLSAGELRALGEDYVVIDDDQYRKFYPNSEILARDYPTYYTDITAMGSGIITPQIMQEAVNQRYNFIFEGTMKNTRILETMKRMPKDIRKIVRVMAASYEEGLLSAFERNEELIRLGYTSRFIKVPEYSKTYDGVVDTVNQIEKSGVVERVEVYRRGSGDSRIPIKVYDSKSKNNSYPSASVALSLERIRNSSEISNNILGRLETILNTPRIKTQEELEQLNLLRQDIEGRTGEKMEER